MSWSGGMAWNIISITVVRSETTTHRDCLTVSKSNETTQQPPTATAFLLWIWWRHQLSTLFKKWLYLVLVAKPPSTAPSIVLFSTFSGSWRNLITLFIGVSEDADNNLVDHPVNQTTRQTANQSVSWVMDRKLSAILHRFSLVALYFHTTRVSNWL